ncbi:hypothetical protein DPMN_169760 [Dreissena polymorpha]|uniref:Uncharacterized protein n=1 Tax=Dreissena polymorpha TaxID=45954 RepID=A0A9D4ICA2_DREPO|nr:hypothetical protein DPMN_169760 [Dreissena polymorpha]
MIDRHKLPAHVKALRIEGIEAVSNLTTLGRHVLVPFAPPRAGLWFPPLDGCVGGRDHCEPLRRPSYCHSHCQVVPRARAVQSPDVPYIKHRPAKISYCKPPIDFRPRTDIRKQMLRRGPSAAYASSAQRFRQADTNDNHGSRARQPGDQAMRAPSSDKAR